MRFHRGGYELDDDYVDPGCIVYVDGFNLYYGALRGTPYRWLDLGKLVDQILKGTKVVGIHYFSAMVKPRPNKPHSHNEQQAYVRALMTDHRVRITWGQFLINKTYMLSADDPQRKRKVRVEKIEEKGSDVNLASHLMLDASKGRLAEAVVITNDSDLCRTNPPCSFRVRHPVGVLNPHAQPAHALVNAAMWVRPIREGVLQASQFPAQVELGNGKYAHRPTGWDQWSGNGSASFKPPQSRSPKAR